MKLALYIILSIPFSLFSQDFSQYIKENAMEVKDISKLDADVYNAISTYELIMVGEMHGTQEPAKLVQSFTNLILANENSVSVGLEIPQKELDNFIKNPSEKTLLESKFFTKKNIDGRNGNAWLELILYCSKNPNINLFFFDNYDYQKNQKRDSIMYKGIVAEKKQYPDNKIITLSGNIHNWRIPFKEMITMGMYCFQDTINFSSEKICSINHAYSEGTMLNNTGNGLELREIDFEESIFSKSAEYENYLVFYGLEYDSRYSCTFYSEKVHHSEKINMNK